ncbi:MAG: TolB protein, partial [Gaiellaceae bacterium]|nr:TolB protein [Gaiellaceae bacterium]
RFLVRGESPEVSPDGHWVAYYPCNACDLYVINADGGRGRFLARGVTPPQWSPDSRHLATLAWLDSDERLLVFDRVTGKHRRLASAPRFLGFDFSHDGRELTFAMSGPQEEQSDIYVAATTAGDLRRVTWDSRSSWPIWEPDGKIDFAHREGPLGPWPHFRAWGKHRIWQIRPDRTERRLVTRRLAPAIKDDREGLRPVAWSDDGRTLLAMAPWEHYVRGYLVDRTGSLRSFGDGTFVDLSRDGRFVLQWVELDGPDSQRTRLELVPVNGGKPRVIARDVGPPSWNR